MDDHVTTEQLTKELESLKAQIAELRMVEGIHKHTEEGLQTIELQLAGIIHSAMDAIITVDENHEILIFNAAAEAMFGYVAYEVIGQSLDQLIPKRFQEEHHHHIQRFGQEKITNRRMGNLGAISGIRSNGEEFPVEASISHVMVSGRRLYTVILRDITERKQAEEQISQLGSLLDDSVNEIFLFDAVTLKFIQVNRGARENLGYSIDEMFNMTPLDIKPEFTYDSFERLLQPLRIGQSLKIDFRTRHRRKNGTQYPVEVHLQLGDCEGSQCFVAIILDLSERVKAEAVLQETQRTLWTLMENLPGMVYRCTNDPDWTMEFVSSGCEQLTGYEPEDFIQNHTVSYGRDVVDPEDRERIWKEVQKANTEHRPFQLFYKLKTADGTNKWVWEQGMAVWSSDGSISAIEGCVFDMTQEKILKDRLQKTERLAELGTLASGMAHEIGTPMNVIMGRAEFLMRKISDGPIKKDLGTIVTQVERITRIMNQLLSFARKRPIDLRSLDLTKVITDVLDVIQDRIKKHAIQVETDFPQNTPNVLADSDQMTQVLLNLGLNACHAMPDGGVLKIGLHPVKDQVELTVTDTGCGISQSNLSKVFDPFFTTKAVGEGTGLGLTVVHGIIQEHEGTISVRSELGKGTTFHIFLPIFTSSS